MSILSRFAKSKANIYQEVDADGVSSLDLIVEASKVVIGVNESDGRLFGSVVLKHGGLVDLDRPGDLGFTVGNHTLREFFGVATPARVVHLHKVESLPEGSTLTQEEFDACPQEITRLEWNARLDED